MDSTENWQSVCWKISCTTYDNHQVKLSEYFHRCSFVNSELFSLQLRRSCTFWWALFARTISIRLTRKMFRNVCTSLIRAFDIHHARLIFELAHSLRGGLHVDLANHSFGLYANFNGCCSCLVLIAIGKWSFNVVVVGVANENWIGTEASGIHSVNVYAFIQVKS